MYIPAGTFTLGCFQKVVLMKSRRLVYFQVIPEKALKKIFFTMTEVVSFLPIFSTILSLFLLLLLYCLHTRDTFTRSIWLFAKQSVLSISLRKLHVSLLVNFYH